MKTISEYKKDIAALMTKLGDIDAQCVTEARELKGTEILLKTELLDAVQELHDMVAIMERQERVQAAIANFFAGLGRVIGDKNSGIVGIITRLQSGDIEGAVELAFGKGSYDKLVTFYNTINDIIAAFGVVVTAIGNISKAMNNLPKAFATTYQPFQMPTKAQKYMNTSSYSANSYRAAVGFATGGSGIVPSGYPNDSYLMGLTSGEQFNVIPSGASPSAAKVGGGGGMVYNNYGIDLGNEQRIQDLLNPFIKEGMR